MDASPHDLVADLETNGSHAASSGINWRSCLASASDFSETVSLQEIENLDSFGVNKGLSIHDLVAKQTHL
jgi:hypothetical protein